MINKTPHLCISQVRGGGFIQLGETAARDAVQFHYTGAGREKMDVVV